MKRKVFVSFRFSDGNLYKEELCKIFYKNDNIIDCSEDKDRSSMQPETIKKYLYSKLRQTSVTIILLTPRAISHEKNWFGKIDDWMYDEISYSLQDREGDKPNGLIAVYTPEAKEKVIDNRDDSTIIKNVNNLYRYNMLNVKGKYKTNPNPGIFDANYDSYCSLVSYEDFCKNPIKYIEIAEEKRDNLYKYEISVRIPNSIY